ncbi:hypothetical protein MMC30_008140 [Trapelia coarctata]|nr:hypothetical protein [Trapelia coarctata]
MSPDPTYASVDSEGCTLHYWSLGAGPLLVLVPGGGGHGCQYNNILPYLAPHFTTVAYDRRQMSLSKVADPKPLNPAQQARDIIAIIGALGYKKASVFANSGGAIITFEFAVSYPEYLDHVICHEGPTTALLDDSTYHLDRTFYLLEIYRTQGRAAAAAEFQTHMIGYEDDEVLTLAEPENGDNFWKNEFLQFTIYMPDLRKIVDNGVSIAVAAGRKSGEAFYARTTVKQMKILRCERFLLPGHHSAFDTDPEVFAQELLKAFGGMERRRGGEGVDV